MRFTALLIGAALFAGTSAQAQSAAELRAQYQQTMEMISQAEAAGLDPAMIASLRESLEGIKETIDEMEREEAAGPTQTDPEPEAQSVSATASAEPNLAQEICSRFGFTEDDYRQPAREKGNDAQIRAMCGQAYEYYAMYKRALDQQHPEAWKTYDAHKQAAAVLNNFWSEAKAAPGSGIVPDTKTAAQKEAERQQAEARAIANAPPKPPPAPRCEPACATPR